MFFVATFKDGDNACSLPSPLKITVSKPLQFSLWCDLQQTSAEDWIQHLLSEMKIQPTPLFCNIPSEIRIGGMQFAEEWTDSSH